MTKEIAQLHYGNGTLRFCISKIKSKVPSHSLNLPTTATVKNGLLAIGRTTPTNSAAFSTQSSIVQERFKNSISPKNYSNVPTQTQINSNHN